MTVKATLAYGKSFHFYHEALDNNHVYLELEDVSYDAGYRRVMIAIPIDVWEAIRGLGAAKLDLVNATDEELIRQVEKWVDARIVEYERVKRSDPEQAARLRFANAYELGAADESRERQVLKGIQYYKTGRERQLPQDFIPTPQMTKWAQQHCLNKTMFINTAYEHDGFVPVIHISKVLNEYISAIKANTRLAAKTDIALGAIVPQLLRMPKAQPYQDTLNNIRDARRSFADKKLHLFGVGGTATLHLAALMGMDSVDSSGYRNRAARGMIQLPGSGERSAIELGSWKGRTLSIEELKKLRNCSCPACQLYGIKGLKATGVAGFRNRATHNLWTLLEEADWIKNHLQDKTYKDEYTNHLDNTIYRGLIDHVVENFI